MTINKFIMGLVLSLLSWVVSAAPVFTLTPLTSTTITVSSIGTATIQYLVTNQSRKTHTLLMVPITGITQVTSAGNCSVPFALAYKQSCILTLQVNGNQLKNKVVGGPQICQQGPNGNPDPLMCYQPSPVNILNITLGGSVTQYTVTPQAGANGTIIPNSVQTVNAGSNLTFTATPNAGFQVAQWQLDGAVVQTGGTTFTLNNIMMNHTVLVTFSTVTTVYTGAENGNVYYSVNNGVSWNATTPPSGGQSVVGVFATHNALYAATADNLLHYSTNNGVTWNNTTPPTVGAALHGIFVLENNSPSSNTLYWASDAGTIYKSTNNGNSWTSSTIAIPCAPAVNAVFAIAGTPNVLYAGSADGFVYYSANDGVSWTQYTGLLDGSQIHNVFVTNSMVFANTADEYAFTNTSLTGGANAWIPYAQTVFSLFSSSDGAIVDAGTQGGYVFSLSTGNELGFVTNSPINSVYVLQ